MMRLAARLGKLVPDLSATLARFPAAAAVDQIYGNLNNTLPLGSARFWLILRK